MYDRMKLDNNWSLGSDLWVHYSEITKNISWYWAMEILKVLATAKNFAPTQTQWR